MQLSALANIRCTYNKKMRQKHYWDFFLPQADSVMSFSTVLKDPFCLRQRGLESHSCAESMSGLVLRKCGRMGLKKRLDYFL